MEDGRWQKAIASNRNQSQAIASNRRHLTAIYKNQASDFLCPSDQQKGAIVLICILYFSNNSVYYTFNTTVIRFLVNF